MMTVKYIDPHGGEQVFPVREVLWSNANCAPTPAGHAPAQGHVQFIGRPQRTYPEVEAVEYVYTGTVYVMNEAGKTVAKYELGGQKLSTLEMAKEAKGLGGGIIAGTGHLSPFTT